MRMSSVVPSLSLVLLLGVATGCPSPEQESIADGGALPDSGSNDPDAGPGDPDAGTPMFTLSLLAGSAGGPGTLDGPRERARFSAPVALARDSQGNVFVADQTSCVIRKIDTSGQVSTFAGIPNDCGYTDGAGEQARFSSPVGIAIDASDVVYVSDSGNNVIRKIRPSGEVSLFAGFPGAEGTADGIGSAARFGSPAGIAIDGARNLYVADKGAYTIRRISPNGEVITLTGNPAEPGFADGPLSTARFTFVTAIASDESGNLWVTEEGQWSPDVGTSPFLIRHISIDGEVSTIAGDPAGGTGNEDGTGSQARFDGLEGITLAADGNLYVVERNNNQLRQVTPAGVVTTIAGAPGNGGDSFDGAGIQARFGMPRGILALPGTGASGLEFLVADYAGATLRYVDTNLDVTTWAGSPQRVGSTDGPASEARFWEASAAIPDGKGGYIVSDTLNHTLRRISPDGTVGTWLGAPGEPGDADGQGSDVRFNLPRGLAFDANGNLFVADSGNHLIRKITPEGTVSLYAGGPGPRGGGDFVDGPRLDARFFTPVDLTFDGAGRMFIADATNNAIRMIDVEGNVSTIAGDGLPGFIDGSGREARFFLPYSLAFDREGNLLVADDMNHALRKLTRNSSEWSVSTFAGALADEHEQPEPGNADGTGSNARFHHPRSISTDVDGNLLVADMANNLLRRVTPSAEVTTWAGQRGRAGLSEGALPATLFEPLSVRALPNGDVIGTFTSGVFLIERD